MAFHDLDLEFEDEEELKKKKPEAVQVDVDLEFQSPEGGKPRPQAVNRPASAGAASHISRPAGGPGLVRKIEDARTGNVQVKRPLAASAQGHVMGSSALKIDKNYDPDSQQVNELRAEMKNIKFDAEVKVQVAEFKTEFLSEMLSDMKLMEHQIGQLLVRINAKHPDMKNEVLMIKKLLADFNGKKRK
jgi:hypothetical protein